MTMMSMEYPAGVAGKLQRKRAKNTVRGSLDCTATVGAPRTAEGGDETMETLAELFRSDPATVIRFVSRMNDVMSEFSQGGRS